MLANIIVVIIIIIIMLKHLEPLMNQGIIWNSAPKKGGRYPQAARHASG